MASRPRRRLTGKQTALGPGWFEPRPISEKPAPEHSAAARKGHAKAGRVGGQAVTPGHAGKPSSAEAKAAAKTIKRRSYRRGDEFMELDYQGNPRPEKTMKVTGVKGDKVTVESPDGFKDEWPASVLDELKEMNRIRPVVDEPKGKLKESKYTGATVESTDQGLQVEHKGGLKKQARQTAKKDALDKAPKPLRDAGNLALENHPATSDKTMKVSKTGTVAATSGNVKAGRDKENVTGSIDPKLWARFQSSKYETWEERFRKQRYDPRGTASFSGFLDRQVRSGDILPKDRNRHLKRYEAEHGEELRY